jgi:hypothetical protein
LDVALGNTATLVGRDIEEELGVAADRCEVNVEEVVESFDLVVLGRVVEPAGAYGDIDLAFAVRTDRRRASPASCSGLDVSLPKLTR